MLGSHVESYRHSAHRTPTAEHIGPEGTATIAAHHHGGTSLKKPATSQDIITTGQIPGTKRPTAETSPKFTHDPKLLGTRKAHRIRKGFRTLVEILDQRPNGVPPPS